MYLSEQTWPNHPTIFKYIKYSQLIMEKIETCFFSKFCYECIHISQFIHREAGLSLSSRYRYFDPITSGLDTKGLYEDLKVVYAYYMYIV